MRSLLKILLAMILCLSLTACAVIDDPIDVFPDVGGTDWRTTGVWRDGGTITRDGEDTVVLVCIHAKDANFYYDSQDQTLFDYVEYPVAIEGDAWEAFRYMDFSDLNGDGNSDVTMHFVDSGTKMRMVWFWDGACGQFVYQPEESEFIADDGQEDPDSDGGQSVSLLDDGEPVPELMCDVQPFADMVVWDAIDYSDGTYYCKDVTEDGRIMVVNTVRPHNPADEAQTLEDYLTDCALSLREADAYTLQSARKQDAYTAQMSYPVYIVTYTAGENENVREWTVFAMDTGRCTYLYGICAEPDAADEVRSVCQDVFAGLYLSDDE